MRREISMMNNDVLLKTSLSKLFDLIKRSGYYRNNGVWRKVGKVTMRVLRNRDEVGIAASIDQEIARRHFLDEETQREEVSKYVDDPAWQVVRECAYLIYPGDHMRMEAFVTQTRLFAEDLYAGHEGNVLIWASAVEVAAIRATMYAYAAKDARDARVALTSRYMNDCVVRHAIRHRLFDKACKSYADLVGMSRVEAMGRINAYKLVS